MKVQLLYFNECPNAQRAAERLRAALVECDVPTDFESIDTSAPDSAETLRAWGSPTILIDSEDVGGEFSPPGNACRLYRSDDGQVDGVPSLRSICEVLRAHLLAESQAIGVVR